MAKTDMTRNVDKRSVVFSNKSNQVSMIETKMKTCFIFWTKHLTWRDV